MLVAIQELLPRDRGLLYRRCGGPLGPLSQHQAVPRLERDRPPCHRRMMVKLLVYAYCVGLPSSRRMEKGHPEAIGFRLVADTPDFRTIADFRKNHSLQKAMSYDKMEEKEARRLT